MSHHHMLEEDGRIRRRLGMGVELRRDGGSDRMRMLGCRTMLEGWWGCGYGLLLEWRLVEVG